MIRREVVEQLCESVVEVFLEQLSGPLDAVVKGGRPHVHQAVLQTTQDLHL